MKIDEKKLEKLALVFCSDFLKLPQTQNHKKGVKQEEGILPKIIGLYGAEKDILFLIKDYMRQYFAERQEEIEILLDRKGYEINIGYFLNDFKEINNLFF